MNQSQSLNNQQYQTYEDEIDLREYINVIIKWKKLVLGVFLASVIGATIYSFQIPKIYEINSTLQLGSINDLLISKEEAKAIILNQNFLSSVVKDLSLKTSVEGLARIIKIADVKDTNLLRIKIEFSDVAAALKINDAILKPLITQGHAIYQQRFSALSERLSELDSEIKNAESDITRTQAMISGASVATGLPELEQSLRIILLQNTLPNYENTLTMLRNQRSDLKLLLANAKPFKIFEAPIEPEGPIKPNKRKMIVLAAVLGLMAGIMGAFFVEFWQRNFKESSLK